MTLTEVADEIVNATVDIDLNLPMKVNQKAINIINCVKGDRNRYLSPST